MSSKLRDLNARFVLLALLLAITASACQLTDGIGPTFTPTRTAQPEDTSTPVPERPPIPSPTATLTPIPTPAVAPTPTVTREPDQSPSPKPETLVPPTSTATVVATPTSTATAISTPELTSTPTSSPVPTAEPTSTPLPTATPEPTITPTPTFTPTPTALEISSALLQESGFCNVAAPPVTFISRPDITEQDWTPPTAWRVEATANHETVQLEWDDLNDPDVLGYRIFRWLVDSDEIDVVDRDSAVTAFIDTDGIYPETKYRYWVFPIKTGALGHPSDPVDVVTPTSGLPSPPRGIHAVASPNSVGLKWAQPKDETIEGFVVLRRDSTGGSDWVTIVDDVARTSRNERSRTKGFNHIDEAEIVPGHEYHYAVCSTGVAGVGAASEVADVVVPQSLDLPAPENVHAEATYKSITLKWDPVDHPAVTGYEVFRRIPKQEDDFNLTQRISGRFKTATTLSYIWQPLTVYEYKIRAVAPLWSGSESEIGSIITPAVPFAHSDLPPTSTNLTARASHVDVWLQWDPVDDPTVTEYRVIRKESGENTPFQAHVLWNWQDIDSENYHPDYSKVTGTVWTDVYEIKPETAYDYWVAAVNANGDSEWSEPVRVTTESFDSEERHSPPTPYNLQAVATEEGIELTWDVPDDPSITGYVVEQVHVDLDLVTHSNHEIDTPEASFVVPHLVPGEEYSFEVRAVNDFGQGHHSERVWATSLETKESRKPAKPQFNFAYLDAHEVYLSLWNLYTEPPWRYRVTRKEYSFDGFRTKVDYWENDRQGYRDNVVTTSKLYWYEFVAFDDDVESEPLNVIVATRTEPRPAEPSNVSTTADDTSVTIRWDDPEDPSITHYIIKRTSFGESYKEDDIVVSGPTTTFVDSDVRPDSSYGYEVSTANSGGRGRRALNIGARTAVTPGLPPAPSYIKATTTGGTITVEWRRVEDLTLRGYVIERVLAGREGSREETTISVGPGETKWIDYEVKRTHNGYSPVDYWYTVKSVNENGLGAASSRVIETFRSRPRVPAPRIVSADATFEAVYLKWDLSCDSTYYYDDPEESRPENANADAPTRPTISSFKIWRTRTEAIEERTLLLEEVPCGENEYADSYHIEPDVAYRYQINAVIGEHESYSLDAQAEVRTGIPGPLPGRTGEFKINEHPVEVYIGLAESWDVPITGYRIHRTLTEPDGSEFTEAYYVDGDPGFWRDLTALPGKKYFYTLAAIGESGIGEARGSGFVTVPLLWDDEPEPAVVSGVPENGNIVVRWSQPDDWKVLNYKILRRQEQPDGSFEWMALAVDDDTTMWVDKPVTEAGYGYYVWAIDPSSRIKRLESLEVFAGPPPPPKPEKLMLSANHNSVTLTWDEQNSEWITGYEILQTDASYHPVGPSITFETGSTSNRYVDESLKPSNPYFYYVRALSPMGPGEWSEPQSIETAAAP